MTKLRDRNSQGASIYMWRGHADERWRIDSAAFRRLSTKNSRPSESDVVHYEKRLLSEATHRGFRRYEGAELSDFELLARLQHHGAATRLIDTTRNALVGLYFACAEYPRLPGILFGMHCWHLGGGEGTPLKDQYEPRMASLHKYDHPQTWEPPVVSPRVYAQHSQFVYSTIKDSTYGSLALGDTNKSLLAIRILPKMKGISLKVLSETYDINLTTLFPDLDGFGRSQAVQREEWSNYRW